MQIGIGFVGLVMALATLVALDLRLPGGLIHNSGDIVEARDGVHHAGPRPALQRLQRPLRPGERLPPPVRNPVLWSAIGTSLVLQVAVVHLKPLNHAFDTTPLSASDWLICAVLASSVLWAEELRKLVQRAWARR